MRKILVSRTIIITELFDINGSICSEELRKTQTKLRDYEQLEREREMKRKEEERWYVICYCTKHYPRIRVVLPPDYFN